MNARLFLCAVFLLIVPIANPIRADEKSKAADVDADQRQTQSKVAVVGSGRAMILLPGLANSGAVWDTTIAHFKSKFECHAFTRPGFGGSPPVQGRFFETMRKVIAEYIRDQKLEKPVIVGHSLGGFLVYLLGASDPELVGPLVVVDAAPCPPAMINEKITSDELKQGEQMGILLASAKREDF
ncbi:MAG: alpha/beta hydrolase [Verrucomicrobiales bacterium]|nr:alpha/beta hydrolase [Verrucomicrobiales bacterium]